MIEILGAEVVLPCDELDDTLCYFRDALSLRLDMIHPADDPREAVLSGSGLRIRLVKGLGGSPGRIRVHVAGPAEARQETAPNGTVIEFRAEPALRGNCRLERTISRMDDETAWIEGRAGMHYRDLVPGRQGGAVVASHIRIPEGGPVPDYVHYHRVRFQFIFCWRGWVRVVYQDQGEPFVLEAGDAVLQPPGIRHRVLESSPGLEVIEVGAPADHETWVDHDLVLPNQRREDDRTYGGQHFVRFQAAATDWAASGTPGFKAADTGILTASRGAVSVRVLRADADADRADPAVEGSLLLIGLEGHWDLAIEGGPDCRMGPGDAACLLPGERPQVTAAGLDCRLLEVRFNLSAPAG